MTSNYLAAEAVGSTDSAARSLERIRPIHFLILLFCTTINLLDGIDLLAVSFTSARVMAEWHVEPKMMGLIFSAGLVGMALGSLTLTPIADRFGRRQTILIGLSLVTFSMLGVWVVPDAFWLAVMRLITGMGVGLLTPSINTLVAEYAPRQWRSAAVSIYSAGFPVGAALCGVVAPHLTAEFGWRSVYVFGGFASLLMIPAVLFLLPESYEFLQKIQPKNALEKMQGIAARLGREIPQALPHKHAAIASPNPWAPFRQELRTRTLLISCAFFMLWITAFFVNNWTPAILEREGFAAVTAAQCGVMLTFGGIGGPLIFAALAARFDLVRLCLVYFIGSFALALAFALAPHDAAILIPLAAVLGFLLYGSTTGLYVLVARVFPLELRATGTGSALAIGRAGAVIGLSTAGLLIGMGEGRASCYVLLSLPVIVAALAVYRLRHMAEGS